MLVLSGKLQGIISPLFIYNLSHLRLFIAMETKHIIYNIYVSFVVTIL
jgi:hypothetical protein